ncbi:histidine phosphatase family protein [Streptomyces sp. NRRL B-1347]|uniref:histidine phosphatase family protein n=1 Tax=Streptomyces sp. NRRL B-1347 TaxID=1476877 RepID=UPI0004CB9096|nr:histidine phosphatase family protein [Streptomyces sp. NRRL B-1347]
MTGSAARHLYLARHGEASPDESELTDAGRRQAALLGERLRGLPLTRVTHGPLPRAEQTARLAHAHLGSAALRSSAAAGDYVPYRPRRDELPAEHADIILDRLARVSVAEPERGADLARAALARFTGPVRGDEPRHELVVTHNFLIGWLVRAALDAPGWRWLGLNHAHAALTVIRYAPDRPASLLLYNDTGHLPAELRWTGMPAELRV